jgi:hypothetical protein
MNVMTGKQRHDGSLGEGRKNFARGQQDLNLSQSIEIAQYRSDNRLCCPGTFLLFEPARSDNGGRKPPSGSRTSGKRTHGCTPNAGLHGTRRARGRPLRRFPQWIFEHEERSDEREKTYP